MPERHENGIHQATWPWRSGGTKANSFLKYVIVIFRPIFLIFYGRLWPRAPRQLPFSKSKMRYFPLHSRLRNSPKPSPPYPGKTAGGITELTYSIMKAWSLPFKKLVFDNLAALWNSPLYG